MGRDTETIMNKATKTVIDGPMPLLDIPLWRRSPLMGLMAVTALAMMPSMGGGPFAADIRNDPDREKTLEDMERIAAAQRKRECKAALHSRHNAKMEHPPLTKNDEI